LAAAGSKSAHRSRHRRVSRDADVSGRGPLSTRADARDDWSRRDRPSDLQRVRAGARASRNARCWGAGHRDTTRPDRPRIPHTETGVDRPADGRDPCLRWRPPAADRTGPRATAVGAGRGWARVQHLEQSHCGADRRGQIRWIDRAARRNRYSPSAPVEMSRLRWLARSPERKHLRDVRPAARISARRSAANPFVVITTLGVSHPFAPRQPLAGPLTGPQYQIAGEKLEPLPTKGL
jgi:hypothetical protein